MTDRIADATGRLFGALWPKLTDEQYRESVALFTKRFEANGFDLGWFRGKKCLDAGCGSGRYAVAMAMHGAAEVIGCDVSETGLAEASRRARAIPAVRFERGSALALPYEDAAFDFVCCAGVLHHTPDLERGLDELVRVLKPSGKLFLLLYGAGGLRWKAIKALRPIVADLGQERLDAAMIQAGLPANNRKHFMDDLFVPIQTLVDWADLSRWLAARGCESVERWTEGRFDHEASPQAQIEDIDKLVRIFAALRTTGGGPLHETLSTIGESLARVYADAARETAARTDLTPAASEDIVIGQGNHRVLAVKGGAALEKRL